MIIRDGQTHDRKAPSFGGFNFTALSLEVHRMLRNRRTLVFIVLFPSLFSFMFGLSNRERARLEGTSLPT